MDETSENHIVQRIRNILHSLLIIGSMFILLGFTAELVLGAAGWWLVFALLVSILIGVRISPMLVMRLYRAQPLSHHHTPELYRILSLLSERAELETLPKLYYIPSAVSTAFTTGTRNDCAIAISDGLLRQLNLREMAGVLGHKISHIRHRDIWVMSLADSVSRMASLLCTMGLILVFAFLPFYLVSEQGLPWLGILLLIAIPNITTLLQLGLSRTREFHADLGAVELTQDPEAMISALAKIAVPRFPWSSRILLPRRQDPNPSLLRTHPPVEERIQRLRELTVRRTKFHETDIHPLPRQFVRVTRRPRRHWSGVWY